MFFQIRNTNSHDALDLNIPSELNHFFIAHAKIINGSLHTYACNNQDWFESYIDWWQDDPIVSKTPPVDNKFSLKGWELSIINEQHLKFFKFRVSKTGAHRGFTIVKSKVHEMNFISEFYAIGALDTHPKTVEQIIEPLFVRKSLAIIQKNLENLS